MRWSWIITRGVRIWGNANAAQTRGRALFEGTFIFLLFAVGSNNLCHEPTGIYLENFQIFKSSGLQETSENMPIHPSYLVLPLLLRVRRVSLESLSWFPFFLLSRALKSLISPFQNTEVITVLPAGLVDPRWCVKLDPMADPEAAKEESYWKTDIQGKKLRLRTPWGQGLGIFFSFFTFLGLSTLFGT